MSLEVFIRQRLAVTKHMSLETIVGLEVFEAVYTLVQAKVVVAALNVQF